MTTTSSLVALLVGVVVACTPQQADPVTTSFDVSVLSIGPDCQLPLLDFGTRTAEVGKLVGSTTATKLYYGLNLEPALAKAGTSLRVAIRQTAASEQPACTTMGPAYASITVTSAVAK